MDSDDDLILQARQLHSKSPYLQQKWIEAIQFLRKQSKRGWVYDQKCAILRVDANEASKRY